MSGENRNIAGKLTRKALIWSGVIVLCLSYFIFSFAGWATREFYTESYHNKMLVTYEYTRRVLSDVYVAVTNNIYYLEQHLLAVVGDVADVLARLGIIDHRSAGHVDVDVLAVRAVTLVPTAVAPVLRKDVALVLQVQQRPVVMVPAQVDVSTPAAVAPVGAAVRVILHVLQVHRPLAALARAAQYLHIVYEVALHLSYSLSTRTRYFVGVAVRHVGLDDAVVLLCSRDTQS